MKLSAALPARPPRRTLATVCAVVLALAWLGAGTPADAAGASVAVRAIAQKTVSAGERAIVAPAYSARKDVRVRSATVTVRRGSRWIARGARSARLAPGTYRVTSQVRYQLRHDGRQGRVRTTSRTQTLRVVARPVAAAPVTAGPPTPSLALTGAACDTTSLRKPDGSPWECTFADEFSGTTLDRTVWSPQETATSGYHLGTDCFVDDPDNIAVGGGVLALTVRRERPPASCPADHAPDHTAGMVTTVGSFAQARGRFEIRAAFSDARVAGHHGALWLFPKHPTAVFPFSGEIDIAETYSSWADRVIPFVHYGSSDPSVTNNHCMLDVSQFHTYTLEWTASTVSIAYDGVVCLTHRIDPSAPGGDPFGGAFMIALTQGVGLGDNAPTASTPATGTTRIDYVRVWR